MPIRLIDHAGRRMTEQVGDQFVRHTLVRQQRGATVAQFVRRDRAGTSARLQTAASCLRIVDAEMTLPVFPVNTSRSSPHDVAASRSAACVRR